MKRPQAALFDRLAARDRLYDYPDASLEALDALVEHKGLTLDIGCGDGSIAAALRGGRVVAFDVSERCATLCARRGVPAVVADAHQPLPFGDNRFDTVYCVDVLHHLEKRWGALLVEIWRVLKPGGTLVIVEPDARNPFVRITQAPGSWLRVAPCDNEPAVDPGELVPLLDAQGYEYRCTPIHIVGEQVERNVFPLWQRLFKAPFILALAFLYRNRPNKFAIIAMKRGETT